jgi:hypothetical protein
VDDPTLLSWIEKGQNIAALLVAIGVAAEFVLGFMANPARKRVDHAKDSEIVRLTNESVALQAKLDFQGPRAELFVGNNVTRPGIGKFVNSLKPFAGQKVELRINPLDIPDPKDRFETQQLFGSLEFTLAQSMWLVGFKRKLEKPRALWLLLSEMLD